MTANALSELNPRWAIPHNLNAEFNKAKAPSLLSAKKFTALPKDMGSQLPFINIFMKTIKGIADYVYILTGSFEAKNIVSQCGLFNDITKFFANLFKAPYTIIENAAKENLEGPDYDIRNLNIASAVFGAISGGAAGFKILDKLGLASISNVQLALGTTSVFPFGVFGNCIEIVKTTLDLTKNAIHVDQLNTELSSLKTRQKSFKINLDTLQAQYEEYAISGAAPTVFDKVEAFLADHVSKIAEKQVAALAARTALEDEVKAANDAAEKALTNYNQAFEGYQKAAAKTGFKYLKKIGSAYLKKASAEQALIEAGLDADAKYTTCAALRSKYTIRLEKATVWTSLKEEFETNKGFKVSKEDETYKLDEESPLNQFITHKQDKWKAQADNCKDLKKIDALAIFMNCLVIVSQVALIALAFTGIGTIPVLLTMTSLFLLISLVALGSELLKRHIPPKRIIATDFTQFAAPAA